MKKLNSFLFCLVLLVTVIGLGAQEWASRAGSTEEDYGMAVATDNSGNSYVTGLFTGTADFGSTQLISSGTYDIFVAKLDQDGNWLWAKKAGGLGEDSGQGIAVDNDGNVYITGYFSSTALFGIFPLTSADYHDLFVAKLTTDGIWLWANRGGGTGYDYGNSITTDENGNCYVSGKFMLTATFGTTNLTSVGNYDALMGKLDTNGLWLWAKRAGGTTSDDANSIVYDSNGYIYVSGSFNYSADPPADFGPYILTSAGSTDIFVCKLNTNGSWQWATRAGGTDYEYAWGIATNGDGRIYISGYFTGLANFNSNTLTSGGSNDIFVAQLDEFGYWVWAVRAGGFDNDSAFDIAVDEDGDVFVTGHFQWNAHFGPILLDGVGQYDIFIAKLDHSGNWLWVKRVGGTSYEDGNGIAPDGYGNCVITGYFGGTADFGSEQLISAGNYDICAAKITDPTPQIPQNVTISNLGNDVIVDWDAVTLDTWFMPITPDYYFVYYNTDGVTEPYQYLTLIPAVVTEYVHQHAGFFSSNHFYQVTAVKFYLADRSGLEDYLNAYLQQGMTEAEVKQVLKKIGSDL